MGPYIATGLDPMNLTVSIKVNGDAAAEYHTGRMIFSAQHYISEISKYMTLWPGDVVWLGTDKATLPDLKHGDVCEIIQPDIGVLRNPVVRAAEPNAAHRAIRELDAQGTLLAVVTQNIDWLHRRSGIPAERVLELHGTAEWARCPRRNR